MSVRMKALRSFGILGANEGPVKRGREFAARDLKRAAELEAHGLAYRMEAPQPQNEMEPQLTNQMEPGEVANNAADQGPLDSAGGETGEPAPSSPPAPRRGRRRSTFFETDSRS